MIDRTSLVAALDACGMPWALNQWGRDERPDPPYAVLVPIDSADFFADGAPFLLRTTYEVQLWAERRDAAAEGRVEAALRGQGIGWSARSFDWVESEQMSVAAWTVTVLGL